MQRLRKQKMAKEVRHVLGISGGKDSAALAIFLHDKVENMPLAKNIYIKI